MGSDVFKSLFFRCVILLLPTCQWLSITSGYNLNSNYSVLTPASVSELCLPLSLPPLAIPDFSQFPSLNMLLCLPLHLPPASHPLSNSAPTLRPSEPLPRVSFKMVLPAPWWSVLLDHPVHVHQGSCSSQKIPSVCLLTVV